MLTRAFDAGGIDSSSEASGRPIEAVEVTSTLPHFDIIDADPRRREKGRLHQRGAQLLQ